MTIGTTLTELIGRTPLLQLAETGSGTRLLLKLEQFNPTGAAKIRMALSMVRDAEDRGLLRPGGRLVESTSGNTGLGLAVVAAERGYQFTAVVDRHACADKLRAMTAMGADLVYVGQDDDLATSAREDLAERIAAQDETAFFTEQHNNAANAVGYYALADELLADLDGTGIDILIGAVGTGGSLFGTTRRLRERLSMVRTIGVEPEGSIAFGGDGAPYWQSGTGTPPGAAIGAAVDYSLLDEGVKVSDVDAFAAARAVAARTGLMIGGSAGGSVHAALTRLEDFAPASTVVAIIGDGGEKYLDTVFDDEWMRARGLLDPDAEDRIGGLLRQLGPRRASEELVTA